MNRIIPGLAAFLLLDGGTILAQDSPLPPAPVKTLYACRHCESCVSLRAEIRREKRSRTRQERVQVGFEEVITGHREIWVPLTVTTWEWQHRWQWEITDHTWWGRPIYDWHRRWVRVPVRRDAGHWENRPIWEKRPRYEFRDVVEEYEVEVPVELYECSQPAAAGISPTQEEAPE